MFSSSTSLTRRASRVGARTELAASRVEGEARRWLWPCWDDTTAAGLVLSLERMPPPTAELYFFDMDVVEATEDDFARILSTDETNRAAHFKRGAVARRYSVAHLLLRRVLARHTGRSPSELDFDVGPQ